MRVLNSAGLARCMQGCCCWAARIELADAARGALSPKIERRYEARERSQVALLVLVRGNGKLKSRKSSCRSHRQAHRQEQRRF